MHHLSLRLRRLERFVSTLIIVIYIFNYSIISTLSLLEVPKVKLEFREDLADVELQNETFAVLTNSNPVFALICSASYPIDWILNFNEVSSFLTVKISQISCFPEVLIVSVIFVERRWSII
jgi:hypothetical protein